MSTKISRQKLKISQFFNSQKEVPKLVTKNHKNYLVLSTPKTDLGLKKLEKDDKDINSYLISSKINIKKKLKQNKTDYNFTQTNNKMNKTFYEYKKPFSKIKSFIDFSSLYKPNHSNHMTQTSISFFNKKEENKSFNLKKIENIKNLELNNSFNENKSNNNVTYIEYHINQILTKKKEKKDKNNNTFNKLNSYKEIKFSNNNKRNFPELLLKLDNNYNNKFNNYYENQKNNINNKGLNNKKNKENLSKNKFHINNIYFKDELENLFHKILIIKNNSNELENFVMSLTNEELKLLYENKESILPLLIKNKSNYNLTEYGKTMDDKKSSKLKNITFKNNLLNLFLKGNKKPIIKKEFPKAHLNENDKNNNLINNDNINKKNDLTKNQIYKKINIKKKSEKEDDYSSLKKDLYFLGYKNKIHFNLYNKEEIKKGEKIWEKWMENVIHKNKKNKKDNNDIYEKIIKKEEEEFKKIIIKKLIRQNSFKVTNNLNNKKKDETFVLLNDVKKDIKNKNRNKSQIINEEKILEKIKKKFLIDIFSYINTAQGKLDLKLILNTDEKNDINKKINTNQIKNKIILESFIPKKFKKKSKNIITTSNPYLKQESEKSEKEESNSNNYSSSDNENDEEQKESEIDDNNNILNNLDYIPISLKKFLLEKYKITEGRYSQINFNIKNGLKSRKNKRNLNKKKIIPKKVIIKVDNHHNEKMVNNFLNNLKNKNNKDANKDIERIYSSKKKSKNNTKNKNNENAEINKKKKEEKRIINIFGINIIINKGISPIQNLNDYMIKKGINSEELKTQINLKNKLTKLINKLQLEKKKKQRKTRIINRKHLAKILDINYDKKKLVKLANRVSVPENLPSLKKLKYFDTSLIKSRKDVEKRKMQILLRFKNDIEYKQMKGDIDETEINMYSKLEQKLGKLMDLNINEYISKIEDYIGEFQEELNRREESRIDEKRINGFIEKLNEDISFKQDKKNYMVNRFGKFTNYENINHINKLNAI